MHWRRGRASGIPLSVAANHALSHTHTHSLSHFLTLFLSHFLTLSHPKTGALLSRGKEGSGGGAGGLVERHLPPSRRSHSHTYSHALTLSHTLTRSHSLTHSHTLSLSSSHPPKQELSSVAGKKAVEGAFEAWSNVVCRHRAFTLVSHGYLSHTLTHSPSSVFCRILAKHYFGDLRFGLQ